MLQSKKGFTLIELLAVIVVLAIVTVIATQSILPLMKNAKIDAFATEASSIILSAKSVIDMHSLNKVDIDNDDNSCIHENKVCFTIDELIDLGVYEGNKDKFSGKVDIDISDRNNLKYNLFLEKTNEFNIINSSETDYSKNKNAINKGGFTEEDIEEYTVCSCVEDTTSPNVTAEAKDNNTSNPKIVFSSDEAGEYCVNTSSTDISPCLYSGNIKKDEEITKDITESNTYYVHVKDKKGNIGISSGVNLTFYLSFGEYLMENKPVGLITNDNYGMYRYEGSNPNNYIDIGGVLYRIIGIVSQDDNNIGLEKYQLKVIKATALEDIAMLNSREDNIRWEDTTLYTLLQSSDILGNQNVIPSSWINKIDSVKWYTGIIDHENYVYFLCPDASIPREKSEISKNYAKVGLQYHSDLSMDCIDIDTSWLLYTGWTMTLIYWDDGNYVNEPNLIYNPDYFHAGFKAWAVTHNSDNGYYVEMPFPYSPVFYLIKNVEYVKGDGSENEPYIVK